MVKLKEINSTRIQTSAFQVSPFSSIARNSRIKRITCELYTSWLIHSFIHPNPEPSWISLNMTEQHSAGFITFATGKTIHLAGNKWYYRAQRWVIGPNDLEINLNSHRVGCKYLLLIYIWMLGAFRKEGGKWVGRGRGEESREHCCQLSSSPWCCPTFFSSSNRLKQFLKWRECNSQPINLGFGKVCHSHDSPRQLVLKSQLWKSHLQVSPETFVFG